MNCSGMLTDCACATLATPATANTAESAVPNVFLCKSPPIGREFPKPADPHPLSFLAFAMQGPWSADSRGDFSVGAGLQKCRQSKASPADDEGSPADRRDCAEPSRPPE